MFVNEERTEHSEIDPAAVRLKGYQRRALNMTALNEKIDTVNTKDSFLLKQKRAGELDDSPEKAKRGVASAVLGQVFDVPE